MRFRCAFAATLLGLSLAGAPGREARAAGPAATSPGTSGIALDQFDPSPAGDAFFGVPSPYARGSWVPRAILLFDYAAQPLKLSQQGEMPSMVVSRQAFLHVDASLTIQDRLLVSVLVPVAVVQGGDSPAVGSMAALASPTSAQIGDVRIGLRVRMIGDDDDPFQLGLSGNVYVPSASNSSFAGETYWRAEPELLAGGRFRAGLTWIYSAYGGFMVRRSENPTDVVYGGGVAASLWDDRLTLGAEAYASTPIQNSQFTFTSVTIPVDNATNAEILFGARVRMFRELIAGWAVGPGLTTALGTPQVRFVGSIGWAPGLPRVSQTQADSDRDGIPDAIDACPYAFGPSSSDPKKNGCPVLDDDEDGIPNDEDACPDKWGVRDPDPKKNGCPPAAPGETPNTPAPPSPAPPR